MIIDAVSRDVVDVAKVFGGVEGLLEVSVSELVPDGVPDLVRPDVTVAGTAADLELAPVAALAAAAPAAAPAPAPAPVPVPAPLLTLSISLLVSLSLLLSLLLVQPLLSKNLL